MESVKGEEMKIGGEGDRHTAVQTDGTALACPMPSLRGLNRRMGRERLFAEFLRRTDFYGFSALHV